MFRVLTASFMTPVSGRKMRCCFNRLQKMKVSLQYLEGLYRFAKGARYL